MKLFFLLSLISLYSFTSLFSQVRNSSFEQSTGLPENVGQFNLVLNWGNCNSSSTPDYYHTNGINGGDLPTTPAAIISPFSGSAIVGLSLYNHEQANVREYISTKLSTPLEIGVKYSVTFKLANGYVPSSSNAGYAIDKIGILFSTNEINQNETDPILESPQFEIDYVFYSRDWQTIKFNFTPDENHEYLTLGVFHSDEEINIELREINAKLAYYFIDNVVISKSSTQLIVRGSSSQSDPIIIEPEEESGTESLYYIPNSFTPNNDGENDVFLPIINTQEDFVFEVYSRWGELIYSTTVKNEGWDGNYKGKPMDQEIYVWTLKYKTFEGEKLVEKQFHGQINLIR